MSKPVNYTDLLPSEVLRGKSIVLSGTTGFVGKVVMSLLLTRYPQIRRIYALIRPGIKARATDRFNQHVLTSPALEPLKKRYGDQFEEFIASKVVPLDGNITKDQCGIDDDTLTTLKADGVDVVINSAGLVDFDPPIDQALNINTLGIQNVVDLAKELDAALVHVSTCFVAGHKNGQILEDDPVVNCTPSPQKVPDEHFDCDEEIEKLKELAIEVRNRAKDPMQQATWQRDAREILNTEGRDPDNPKALKSAVLRCRKKWLSQELRRVGMERATFWGWTNTYTFTKHLGEQLVLREVEKGTLNGCIVRPSIVESSLEFPFPGWNEGFTTTAPLILLTRQGLPHFPYDENLILDIVPVDMVAGVVIAASAALLDGPHKRIYQVSTGDTNPLTVKQSIELTGLKSREDARLAQDKGLRQWWVRQHEMQPIHLGSFEKYSVPAYKRWADKSLALVERGQKGGFFWPRQSMSELRKMLAETSVELEKAEMLLRMFIPFTAENSYIFRTDNSQHLIKRVPVEERKGLHFKPHDFLWRKYWFDVHVPGLEKWVFPKLEAELSKPSQTTYVYRDIIELFEAAVHNYRHRVAFRLMGDQGEEYLTYGQVNILAQRVATFLVAQGVKMGERVALACENRPEWPVSYFGVLLTGATVVPVDAQAKVEEVENIARSAQVKGLLVSPSVLKRWTKKANPLVEGEVGDVWALEKVLRASSLTSCSKNAAQTASIIYTSGTTGDPKGVMLSQRNFTFEVSRLLDIFDLQDDDHILSLLPLHHTFEFTAGLLTPFSCGAQITYLENLSPETLSDALKSGVTSLIGVPALWELLQRKMNDNAAKEGPIAEAFLGGVQNINLWLRDQLGINAGALLALPVHRALGGRLRHLVSGGAALDPQVMKFFRGLGFNLTEGYGLTETAPVLTVTDPSKKIIAGSVGTPLAGVEIKIHAPNNDGVGEVWARGPNVMQGYFGKPELSAEVIDAQGWFHTGDLGRQDEEGRLYLVGRSKDVVVDADGRNAYPDELEDIYRCELMRELSIVGMLRKSGKGEYLAGVVVADCDGNVTESEKRGVEKSIRQHIRKISEDQPYHRRLKEIAFFEGDLPRTATRKIKRSDVKIWLAKHLQNRESEGKNKSRKSQKAVGHVAIEVVAKISAREPSTLSPATRLVGDLGFDSLAYVELGSALETRGVGSLSAEDLMALENIEDVSRLLGEREKPEMRAKTQGEIVGYSADMDDASLEKVVFPIPAAAAVVGKRLMGWGQKQFYERVMDFKVVGQGHIPRHCNFLVAANHTSHLDAGLAKMALGDYGRRLKTLGARDYFFGSRLRRTYFENFTNVVPIERFGSVKKSLRRATDILSQGSNLLLFPEGTRSEDGKLCPFKPSLGYLALQANVTILPMYLWGTYEAMPKGSSLIPTARRIGAVIGPAIDVQTVRRWSEGYTKSETYQFATLLAEAAVGSLKDQGYYRVDDLAQRVKSFYEKIRKQPSSIKRTAKPTTKDYSIKEKLMSDKSGQKQSLQAQEISAADAISSESTPSELAHVLDVEPEDKAGEVSTSKPKRQGHQGEAGGV
jgi:long-chain acyl-CoA synthetase